MLNNLSWQYFWYDRISEKYNKIDNLTLSTTENKLFKCIDMEDFSGHDIL